MSRVRPFTDGEIKRVNRNLVSTRDRLLFLFGCRTGLRISELLRLKVGDVHGKVSIVVRGKGNRVDEVSLHPALVRLIDRHIREAKLSPEDFLFRSREGGNRPIDRSQAFRILKRAAARLDGRIGTHSMRKYFARKIYRHSGKDLNLTATALRHTSLENTRTYLAFEHEAEVARAIRKIKW